MREYSWLSSVDGLPEDPRANPRCIVCRGHGVVDVGTILCELNSCPDCIDVDDVDDYIELGVAG